MFTHLKDSRNSKIFFSIFIAGLSFYLISTTFSFYQIVSLKYNDLITLVKYALKKPPSEAKNIVFLKIDDNSIRTIDKPLPWPRTVFTSALEKILPQKPRVVVMDSIFIGKGDDQNQDLAFIEKLSKNKNIIVGAYLENIQYFYRGFFNEKTVNFALVDYPRDIDSYIRRTRLITTDVDNGIVGYSMAIKSYLAYFGLSESDIKLSGNKLIITSKSQPSFEIDLDKNKTIAINFMIDEQRIESIPFWEIFSDSLPENLFKDKIVVIGNTSELHHDNHPSPLGIIPGSILVTNDILTLLTNNCMKFLPLWLIFLVLILICTFISYLTYRFSAIFTALISLFILVAFFVLSVIIAFKNYTTDFFAPVFMTAFTFFLANSYKYIGIAVEVSHLKTMAITDELTGLYIYRYFKLTLPVEFHKAVSGKSKFSLVIIDVDHFKQINDTYGHNQGNTILAEIGKILKSSSRQESILCRYGGDEFIAVLSATSQKEASFYADRIRKTVESHIFRGMNDLPKVTVSCGVCGLSESWAKSSEQLLEFADVALYHAKQDGRNQIHIYSREDKQQTHH